MTRPFATARLSHLAAIARAAAPIALAALPLLPFSAAGQPLPVARLAYSAKFLCGAGSTGIPDASLPPTAGEMTVIEVHNPHTFPVTITIKWVQDYPTSLNPAIPPYDVTLGPNEGLNLDCEDWELPGCPPICGTSFRGFVEILSPQQLKVVALYKETMGFPGLIRSASVAKKSSPFFLFPPWYRHSATFMVGDDVDPDGETIRHETTVSLANMSDNPVSANIHIVSSTGPVTSFLRNLPPNGFTAITGADLPPVVPRPFVGGVTVEYQDAGVGVLLECEEIIQKHVISGTRAGGIAMSVVEVQPIPLRP